MINTLNLTKSFDNKVILDNITFRVPKGQKVAILGPSGSGKSTLLRCLSFLDKPDSGKIFFEGEEITKKGYNLNSYHKKAVMVFQNFNLFDNLTVLKNITIAPILHRLKTQKLTGKTRKQIQIEEEENALMLLKRIGLSDKALFYPSQLSGGQKQRIAIIRTLALNPLLMMLDEPTSALDPEMIKEVLELIKDVAKSDITMIIVTHEMAFARNVSDRIIFMDNGKILEDNTPNEFFDSPKNERLKEFLSKVL